MLKLRELRRGVEEVDSVGESSSDGGNGVGFRNRTEDFAEGRGAETDGAEFETGVTQWPEMEMGH